MQCCRPKWAALSSMVCRNRMCRQCAESPMDVFTVKDMHRKRACGNVGPVWIGGLWITGSPPAKALMSYRDASRRRRLFWKRGDASAPTCAWQSGEMAGSAHRRDRPVMRKTPSLSGSGFSRNKCLTMTYSRMGTPTLPSALSGFTAEFGKGSGGSRTLWSSGEKGNANHADEIVSRVSAVVCCQSQTTWVLYGQASRAISIG